MGTVQSQDDSESEDVKSPADIGLEINELEVTVSINDFTLLNIKPEHESISYLGLIDYWEIDWNYSGKEFTIGYYSCRKIKDKKVVNFVSKSASHSYKKIGEYTIVITIVDVQGNSYQNRHKVKL